MGKKIFAAFVAVIFLYVAYPLLFPVLMGGVIAVLFNPVLERLEKRNISIPLASGLLTFAVTVTVILPSSLLIFFGVKTGFSQLQQLNKNSEPGMTFIDSIMANPRVHSFMLWVTKRFPLDMNEFSATLQDLLSGVGSRLTELLGGMLGHLPGILMALLVVVLSLYFFLVDGRKLVHILRRSSFFAPHQTEQLIETVAGMCRSVILAAVVSGGVQAIIEVLACIFTGTSNVALIGLLVFISSFIPVVAAAPITFGVAIQSYFEGHQIAAFILLAVALVIVAVDNMVRPLFLKGAANLHPLLAFVATLGGLQTLGFLGVFLGPILAALFVVTFQVLSYPED